MIEPLKATKGRRMSKKTRKKSPKTPAKAAAAKSGGKSNKKAVKAAPKASHKVPSKKLTPSASRRPAAKAAAAPRQSGLTEGAKAPAFRLPRDGGATVSLADYAGKNLVLFFYPRADTPGCTREAIDFTRLGDAFAKSRTAVVGISADPPRAQEAFRDKHELSMPLVSDERHEMLEAYGAWGEKSMYGRTFQGILRTTVLIGSDGRVAKIWRHVKVDGHADEVLAATRAL
jgi:peroxiredoxin Q/BCP